MSYNANFDTENIKSVELNLLDSQVDLISDIDCIT